MVASKAALKAALKVVMVVLKVGYLVLKTADR
jgi:hypothetical protein